MDRFNLINNGPSTQINDEIPTWMIYDCQSVDAFKNDEIFPNPAFFQAFLDTNSLLSQIWDNDRNKSIEYSMSDGVLLHMYRNCGISEDEHDLDFIVPYKHILSVRSAFEESEQFEVYRQSKRLKEKQIGYHFACYHKITGVKIDIFSLNNLAQHKWQPMWIYERLYSCWLPKNLTFGYRLKVNEFEFNVIGPIEDYLVSMYGSDWKIPIDTKDWDWRNPRCKPYRYLKKKKWKKIK